jgi:hypothetical protein
MANENDSKIMEQILSTPDVRLASEVFRRNAHRIIDDATYWNILGVMWKMGGTVIQQDHWKEMFRCDRRQKHKIMKNRERKRWRKLPKIVTAYRAINTPEEIETAISWTLNRKTAEQFSWNGERKIIERNFHKTEIFAFFDRRQEDEIIVNIK